MGDKESAEQKQKTTQKITWYGVSLSIPDWADRSGLPCGVLRSRIKAGWTIEEALTTPARQTKKRTA